MFLGRNPPAGESLATTRRVLAFELHKPTITLNQLLALKRKGDWAVKEHKKRLAWEINLALAGKLPRQPFNRAALRVARHSLGAPDYDGMVGGLKTLIDCLLPQGEPYYRKGSRRPIFPHPFGLGIVADDSERVLTIQAVAIRVASAAEQKTIITITEL